MWVGQFWSYMKSRAASSPFLIFFLWNIQSSVNDLGLRIYRVIWRVTLNLGWWRASRNTQYSMITLATEQSASRSSIVDVVCFRFMIFHNLLNRSDQTCEDNWHGVQVPITEHFESLKQECSMWEPKNLLDFAQRCLLSSSERLTNSLNTRWVKNLCKNDIKHVVYLKHCWLNCWQYNSLQ